ncbi:Crp/Fnr family transcriptional regulator [Flagellimonas sp. S3867]|uniref:Crp/Fnr family transcriptional regulator n=1 Tax=Flagellimonas sp. S3867 TaxID=2768063 RepID=UPI001684D3ED|nr:Crp/Fnr family transcriptional regulator [Flagellimonas sp. S3867]
MKTLTKYWFLEGFSLFRKLGMPTMMKMCELLEMEHIDKGKIIEIGNRDKKSIFFLKKGSVKILNSSRNTAKYIVKKGNIFGELSLYDEQAAIEEQAITLEDSIICYIESDMMEALMEKHKSLKNGVFKVYGLRIKKLERRLEDLIYKDSKTRISDFIYSYVKEFGEDKTDRIEAKNLLSHKDIANLTNTSRQTVNNVLSGLRKDNRIDYNTREISILK